MTTGYSRVRACDIGAGLIPKSDRRGFVRESRVTPLKEESSHLCRKWGSGCCFGLPRVVNTQRFRPTSHQNWHTPDLFQAHIIDAYSFSRVAHHRIKSRWRYHHRQASTSRHSHRYSAIVDTQVAQNSYTRSRLEGRASLRGVAFESVLQQRLKGKS